MENNFVALNSTVNFLELIAIIGGGLYLDKRIRQLEGKSFMDFPKLEAGGNHNSKKNSTIDLEKRIATLSRRLDSHDDIMSMMLLNMESKSESGSENEERVRKVRLNVSPGRSGTILRGRSRVVSTEKNPSFSEPRRSMSPEPEFKIDLDKYQDLD